MGYLSWLFIFQEPYRKKEIKETLSQMASLGSGALGVKHGTGDVWWLDQVEVLHPYFGFSRDPSRNEGITHQGFPGYRVDQLAPKKDDTSFRVAIFGGSFAKEVFFLTIEQLRAFFRQYHANVEIVNCSVGGYKQPQQLMVLNYLLAVGVDIDMVINIDGFNEVALPYVENLKHGVSPFYPRNWITRSKNTNNPDHVRLIGKIELLKQFRSSLARRMKRMKLYRSPTLSLLWQLVDHRAALHMGFATLQMNDIEAKGEGFYVQGPDYPYRSDEGLYRDLTALWMNCSMMMHALCESNGIAYYHFLQPNQYVPGSKIISPKERVSAFDIGHPYRQGVLKGYSLLGENGRHLMERGVKFKDLTGVFENNDATLYKDTCCHLNEIGYHIVVERICDFIHGCYTGG